MLYQTDFVLIENVMGIISKKDNGKSFLQIMVQDMQTAGYKTDAAILNAAAYGAPQNQRRGFLLKYRKSPNPGFPKPLTHYEALASVYLLQARLKIRICTARENLSLSLQSFYSSY